MSILNSILRTSLEDAGLIDPVETEATSAPEELEEAQVEAAEAQVDAAEAEVEQNEQALDQMEVAAESLQRVYDRMAHYQANGTVSQEAADFMILAAKNALAPFGMESLIDQTLPSMEAFSGGSASATSLNMAMESIGETLKQWWEATKKFFIKIYDSVAEFFARWFTAVGRLKARLEKTKEAAGKMKNPTGDIEGGVKLKGMAAEMWKDGYKSTSSITEVTKAVIGEKGEIARYTAICEKTLDELTKTTGEDEIKEMNERHYKEAGSLANDFAPIFNKEAPKDVEARDGIAAKATEQFYGGVVFVQFRFKDAVKSAEEDGFFKRLADSHQVGKIKKVVVDESIEKLEVDANYIDKAKIDMVIGGVTKILNNVADIKALKKEVEEARAGLKKYDKDLSANKEVKFPKFIRWVAGGIIKARHEHINALRTVNSHSVKIASTALDFAYRSVVARSK